MERQGAKEGKRKVFDVIGQIKRFTFREKQELKRRITIVTLNIGGLRSPY